MDNSSNRYKYNGNNTDDNDPYPYYGDDNDMEPPHGSNGMVTDVLNDEPREQHEDEYTDSNHDDDNNIYGTDFTNTYNSNYSHNNNNGEEYETPETMGVGGTPRADRSLVKTLLAVLCIMVLIGLSIGLTIAFVSERMGSSLMEEDVEIMENIRLQQIHNYLVYNNIVPEESLWYDNSPQALAAKWMALHDPAQVRIPLVPTDHLPPTSNNNMLELEVEAQSSLFLPPTPAPGPGQERDYIRDTVNHPEYDFLQRYLMVLFYYNMNGGNWIHDLNFLSGDSICTWFQFIVFVNEEYIDDFDYIQQMIADKQIKPVGISCTQDFVIDGIFMDDNNITGTLPTELALLTNMQVMNLDYNYIIGQIPTDFAKLTQLQGLYLGQNAIWGTIPTWIHQLTQLQTLILDHNLLTGPLPIELLIMTTDTTPDGSNTGTDARFTEAHLQTLALDNNMLTGSISHVFGRGTNLKSSIKHILLEDNYLVEEVNDFFLYGLSNLEILDVSSNQLYGIIPEHFFNPQVMGKLNIVDLHSNKITNFAFSDMDNYNIEFLALQNNQIQEGSNVSTTLLFLHNLRHLDLSNNSLTVFPTFYDYNPDAYHQLEDEFILGGIEPATEGKNSSKGDDGNAKTTTATKDPLPTDTVYSEFQPKLEYLFLAHNPFPKGPIPNSLQYLSSSLKELSLKATQLTGTIPTFVGDSMTNLILLDLDDNALAGAIPPNLRELSNNLQFLLLNNNQLNSTIPDNMLTSLTNLRLAFFDNNEITGNLNNLICDGDQKTIRQTGRTSDDNLPYIIADCNTPNRIKCSCCDVCCPLGGGGGGDDSTSSLSTLSSSSTQCHENDWIPNIYPQWQYGYNRTFYLFGDRVGFFPWNDDN